MTEFQQFKLALARTESSDEPFLFGDAGRACGRWQLHPEFFSDYAPRPAKPGETWDQWFERALTAFWLQNRSKYVGVVTLAMIFHLGLRAWETGAHDDAYLQKFELHWNSIEHEMFKTEVS